jgi:NAD+ kinase
LHEAVELRRDGLTAALLEQGHPTVALLRIAHEEHEQTLRDVLSTLQDLGARTQVVSIPHQPFSVRGVTLVVTVGGDGTLLAASRQCDAHTPILGINSAPSTSVGFFCALKSGRNLRQGLRKALEGKLSALQLARMEVRLNRRPITRRVLNEALFCHASPAATSRYIVQLGDDVEEHKSSGFWIGPAAGSTAAQHSAGGSILPLSSRRLQFVVREPFMLAGRLRLAKKLVGEGRSLVVFSKMQEAKLFLDGPHTVIDVGLGSHVRFALSPEPLIVLGLTRGRGRSPQARAALRVTRLATATDIR